MEPVSLLTVLAVPVMVKAISSIYKDVVIPKLRQKFGSGLITIKSKSGETVEVSEEDIRKLDQKELAEKVHTLAHKSR